MRAVVLLLLLVLVALPARAQSDEPSKWWFSVDRINSGLADPREVDRETPQATLESFLAYGRSSAWSSAVHLLDLREVPSELRAEVGPQLAERLYRVLKRRVWVDWERTADRPDGQIIGNSDDPVAGEPRRSIRLAVLDLGDRPVPIRMNRLKPENGDPVWLFSRQTVENVDALHAVYGPTPLEEAMPKALRADLFLGLELWEALLVPVLFLLAFASGALAYRTFRRLEHSADGKLVSRIAGSLKLPFALFAGGLTFWLFAKYVISFNGVVSLFLGPLVTGLFVLAGIILVARTADAFVTMAVEEKVEDVDAPEETSEANRAFISNVSGARRLAIVVLTLLGVGIVLSQTNLLTNLGFAALGTASVFTLILAFAGRAVLSNIMASLQIAFSKPARIGDTLMFRGDWCTVERIHFTYVELRVWDDRLLIVPVNEFVSESFENLTKNGAELVRTVFLTLDHRASVDQLRDVFLEWVQEDERVTDKESAAAEVYAHDRSGTRVRFRFKGYDPSTSWTAALEIREMLLRRATELEARTGEPILPVERELKVTSQRAGLAEAAE